MRIIAIADTHGRHSDLIIPPGDVLIHAGDMSMKGTEQETVHFIEWFSQQDFKHKIFKQNRYASRTAKNGRRYKWFEIYNAWLRTSD